MCVGVVYVFLYPKMVLSLCDCLGGNSGVARHIVLSSSVFLLNVWFVLYLLVLTLDIELVLVCFADNLILGYDQQRVMLVTSVWVYVL